MPASVLRGAFGVVARGAALLGREPPAYPDAVDYLLRPGTYSIAAARGLGYAPRVRLDEGMEEVRQWLEAEGLLDR
jgi:nucleoside-diphosphate-sugar epimerase